MNTTPLNKSVHNRKDFDCGVDALNNYLQVMASQQAIKDNTRTYVLENSKNPTQIIGYYTLTMTSLDLSLLPNSLQKKHNNTYSAGLIARLAVDKRYIKQGYGEWLLIDSLHKLLYASETVAFPFIMVDSKEGAVQFYKKLGFKPFLDTPNKLYMTIMDVRKSLSIFK